jgi:hypothetical protein
MSPFGSPTLSTFIFFQIILIRVVIFYTLINGDLQQHRLLIFTLKVQNIHLNLNRDLEPFIIYFRYGAKLSTQLTQVDAKWISKNLLKYLVGCCVLQPKNLRRPCS